ncbi:MAG: hypothetical protein ACXWWL_04205 [Candidatus Limnocylindria bacterium]
MATPKPGEIRCPTCHRSTPPAAFCTQCGSAIPADARIRPRGLDRDELQERIRARRSGSEPYRRGGAPGEDVGGYQRFQPEPEDRAARRSGADDAPRPDLLPEAPPPPYRPAAAVVDPLAPATRQPYERPDLTRERDDWTTPSREPEPVAAGHAAPYRAPVEDYREADGDGDLGEYEQPAYVEDYDEWDEEPRERRSAGAGAIAILGFLALGVLALLGGAVLAGVFGDDPQTGAIDSSPSPSVSASVAATEAATPAETPSAEPEGTPRASGDVIVFPDGFTAEAQPCLPGSADVDGCRSNGSTNGGTVDIWVGFTKGTEDDVISAELIRADGSSVGTGTIPLGRIGCSPTCPGGWTYFPFSGLPEGTYEVLVTRNGEPAGETSFVVS